MGGQTSIWCPAWWEGCVLCPDTDWDLLQATLLQELPCGQQLAPMIVTPEASPAAETHAPDQTPLDEARTKLGAHILSPLRSLCSSLLWTVHQESLKCGDLK